MALRWWCFAAVLLLAGCATSTSGAGNLPDSAIATVRPSILTVVAVDGERVGAGSLGSVRVLPGLRTFLVEVESGTSIVRVKNRFPVRFRVDAGKTYKFVYRFSGYWLVDEKTDETAPQT